MRKSFIAIFASCTLLFVSGVAFAAQGTVHKDMSISEVIKLGEQQSSDKKKFEYKKNIAEIDLDIDDNDKLKYIIAYYDKALSDKIDDYDKEYTIHKEENIEKRRREYEFTAECYKIYELTSNLDLIELKKKYAEKELEIEKKKYDNGKITKVEVDSLELELRSIKLSVAEAENNLEKAKKDVMFKINANGSLDEFSLKKDVLIDKKYTEHMDYNENEIYECFLNMNYEYGKEKLQLDHLSEIVRVVKEHYGDTSDEFKHFNNTFKIAEINEKNDCNQYQTFINSLLFDYDQKYEEYQIYEDYYDMIQDKEKILEASYNNGQISEIDYLDQKITLEEEKNKCKTSTYSLVLCIMEIELAKNGILLEK